MGGAGFLPESPSAGFVAVEPIRLFGEPVVGAAAVNADTGGCERAELLCAAAACGVEPVGGMVVLPEVFGVVEAVEVVDVVVGFVAVDVVDGVSGGDGAVVLLPDPSVFEDGASAVAGLSVTVGAVVELHAITLVSPGIRRSASTHPRSVAKR